MPIELGYSWFSAKAITVARFINSLYSKALIGVGATFVESPSFKLRKYKYNVKQSDLRR